MTNTDIMMREINNESDEKGNTIFDRAAFENEYDPDYFEQQRLAYEEESETRKQYREHHIAWARGYISRKPNSDGTYGYREPYNGRYGKGYIEHKPSWSSTQYHTITYHIETEE